MASRLGMVEPTRRTEPRKLASKVQGVILAAQSAPFLRPCSINATIDMLKFTWSDSELVTPLPHRFLETCGIEHLGMILALRAMPMTQTHC